MSIGYIDGVQTTVPSSNQGPLINVAGVPMVWDGSGYGNIVPAGSFADSAVSVAPESVRFAPVRSERIVSPISGDPIQVCDFSSTIEEVPGWIVSTSKAWRMIDVLPDGRLVACGANGDRVFWSHDGVKWTPFLQCPIWSWQGMCVVKGGAFAGRIIVGSTDSGIWWSGDGSVWTQGLSGVACRALASTSDGAIYAGGTGGMGMRKSVDGGITWTTVSAWTFGDIYQALGTDGGTTLYAANNGGQVRSSTNGGTSFAALGSATDGWRGFLKSGSNLYAATSNGLRTSADNGATWGAATTAMGTNINGLVLREGILFTGQVAPATVIAQSSDFGATATTTPFGASVTISGGALRFAEVGARRYKPLTTFPCIGERGVPWDSLVADIQFSQSPVYVGSGSDASFDVAILGWRRDASNYLVCEVNNLTGSVYFRGAYAATAFASTVAWTTTTQAMRLAVQWTSFGVSLWSFSDGQWTALVSYRIPDVGGVGAQFWDVDGWYRCVGSYCSVAASVLQIKRLEVGMSGRVGLRDLCAVTYEDGSPYTDTIGRVYLTATVAPPNLVGSGLNGVQICHCGVFLYDPANRQISGEVGRIYTRHVSASPALPATRGNSPIKVVCDRNGSQWILLVSDWSDGGRNIRIVRQKTSPLHGPSIVDGTEVIISSPDGSTYAYDADLLWYQGLWRMVMTWGAVNGNNALVTATTLDGLKTASKKVITSAGEGPRWNRIGGQWLINVSGHIRDLNGDPIPSMPRIDLDIGATGQGTPHLTLIPVRVGCGTRYDVVSFDGQMYQGVNSSLTNGAVTVWSSQCYPGQERF